MTIVEQQFSAAILGPRPSPPEHALGRATWALQAYPGFPCRPQRRGRCAHASQIYGVGKDSTALTGSGGGQVARRKPGDPAGSPPDPGPPSDWPDLIAFMAVLATGTLLVLFGHVATGGLTTACLALGGLYAAWWRFRRPRRHNKRY